MKKGTVYDKLFLFLDDLVIVQWKIYNNESAITTFKIQ